VQPPACHPAGRTCWHLTNRHQEPQDPTALAARTKSTLAPTFAATTVAEIGMTLRQRDKAQRDCRRKLETPNGRPRADDVFLLDEFGTIGHRCAQPWNPPAYIGPSALHVRHDLVFGLATASGAPGKQAALTERSATSSTGFNAVPSDIGTPVP